MSQIMFATFYTFDEGESWPDVQMVDKMIHAIDSLVDIETFEVSGQCQEDVEIGSRLAYLQKT